MSGRADREKDSVEPTTSGGELMVTGEPASGNQKKDSYEDSKKREWESGLDTPVGLRHPHSHTSHPFHDARVYMT